MQALCNISSEASATLMITVTVEDPTDHEIFMTTLTKSTISWLIDRSRERPAYRPANS